MRPFRSSGEVAGRLADRTTSLAPALLISISIQVGGRGPWAPAATAQEVSPEALDVLRFRHIGPVGSRVISAPGSPGDPLVGCASSASGGLWNTVDEGLSWDLIFDDIDDGGRSWELCPHNWDLGGRLGLLADAVPSAEFDRILWDRGRAPAVLEPF